MSERGEDHRGAPAPARGGVCAPVDAGAGRAQHGVARRASMRCASARSSWAGRASRWWSSTRTPAARARRATGRLGFKELVAEVGLGQVGLVLALEVSRLARSLGGLASAAGSVRADRHADRRRRRRLFAGRLQRPAAARAEGHDVRGRAAPDPRPAGRRAAQQGRSAASCALRAAGRARPRRGRPDRAVPGRAGPPRDRARVRAVAAARVGAPGRDRAASPRASSCRAGRSGSGGCAGRAPSYGAVHDFLTNPAYAGAFVFGRTRTREARRRRTARSRSATSSVPLEEWSVCLPEHHPGYVSWPEYLATRERLRANVRPRGEGGGAAREGAALLQGLVRCGRCGRRMQVAYSGSGGRVAALCVRARPVTCMAPSSLPVARRRPPRQGRRRGVPGGRHPGRRRRDRRRGRASSRTSTTQRLAGQRLALERAEFEADRARRQFDACEPEHRLVARTLERALEEALAAVERERAASSPRSSTPARRRSPTTSAARSARLARDLPRLWHAATTTDRDRKELLRTLIREVVVTVHARPSARADGRDRLGGRRAHRAAASGSTAAAPRRRRTGRGHDRADPPPRRAPPRPPDRRDPQQPGPPHRHRPAVHRSPRARHVRQRAGIPAAPPPDPDGETGHDPAGRQRARRLAPPPSAAGSTTACCPASRPRPHAPWRIRLTDEIRAPLRARRPRRLLALDEAATALGCARQTVLHKVQRGELHAIQVTRGRRKGLASRFPTPRLDRLIND